MKKYFIDAGVEHIKVVTPEGASLLKNDNKIETIFEANGLWENLRDAGSQVFVTGKMASIVVKKLAGGKQILPAAVYWTIAKEKIKEQAPAKSLGIIDLSASGYLAMAVDESGELLKDNLAVNPRCGAGSGTNLSRVLQKLDIARDQVDVILKKYLGEAGFEERVKVGIRADRCGVFSSSATVSDKNQGIALDFALATTLKSEVLKACNKLTKGVEIVYLTGRVFNWQYARDCASDYLLARDTKKIIFDEDQTLAIDGLKILVEKIGIDNFKDLGASELTTEEAMVKYASFPELYKKLTASGLYLRLPDEKIEANFDAIKNRPVNIAMDIGSTMAKVLFVDAQTDEALYLASLNNHGDTIDTVKHVFKTLKDNGVEQVNIQHIGVTGSGRYQVQKALRDTYPHLGERVEVLVENYAHARGSLAYAKQHLANLKKAGKEVNEKFCLLVDVGGEDTKISVLSLATEDLHDNAMNLKCSAGTGSLMDTLRAMFDIASISEATSKAMQAANAWGINATCAVFLMENARKLQLLGYPKEEILASAYWAIVENMGRTLWPQIDFPNNAIVLLHGQTMLSDPLPLAVAERLQSYVGNDAYCLVPPYPGHRACFGLLRNLKELPITEEKIDLNLLLDRQFERKVFVCRGAVCGDKNAACSRSMLSYTNEAGVKKFIMLGGCTAINDFEAKKEQVVSTASVNNKKLDTYGDLWRLVDSNLPKNMSENRLVIPRSFAVSETAFFLAKILENLNLPVSVDNITAADVLAGQTNFNIDICAPLIGAAGQFMRLANEQHKFILVPQLDYLPTAGKSIGRTCTTNQGGLAIAMQYGKRANAQANFHLFDLSIKTWNAEPIAKQLEVKLKSVFESYGLNLNLEQITEAVNKALEANKNLRQQLAEKTAEFLELAIAENRQIVIACGREYLLNPGVYDSHVGRLFGDKGVVILPSSVLDLDLEEEFGSMYWRNPHFLLSLVRAVRDKKLNTVLHQPALKEVVKKIEDSGTHIGLTLISTFRCGPDTMMLPIIQEVTKDIPFLTIQSDAAINELAHLENRVNTYLNQLGALALDAKEKDKLKFVFGSLEKYTANELNAEEDVLYFPTLDDNRMMSAVCRAAGFTCLDNFDDDTYDITALIKLGRKFTGDTICAPFAGVMADTMLAVKDFLERKKRGELKNKKRLVIFNNKGTGPCRQGQYYEIHRLFLHREVKNYVDGLGLGNKADYGDNFTELNVQYIIGAEQNNYNIGLAPWALVQGFQAVVAQAVFHAIYLAGASQVKDRSEFNVFRADYIKLKKQVFEIFEHQTKPGIFWQTLEKKFKNNFLFQAVQIYFGSGLYNNNGLRGLFRDFSNKWLKENDSKDKLLVHIEGEAYMRVAQIDIVLRTLISSLGFNACRITNSPLWVYMEYTFNENIIEKTELLSEEKNKVVYYKLAIWFLRGILAGPLYKAAGLAMPDRMDKILEQGREILPTAKPYGELVPYTGEAIHKLRHGYDLFLNVAPEGCMVAGMGEVLDRAIYKATDGQRKPKARIQGIFSMDGEVDAERLSLAILKILSPEAFYKKAE